MTTTGIDTETGHVPVSNGVDGFVAAPAPDAVALTTPHTDTPEGHDEFHDPSAAATTDITDPSGKLT
jgi:hypothetical protein